jgi:small subunit ribosomal protein S21
MFIRCKKKRQKMKIIVYDNDIDKALRVFKRKIQREGTLSFIKSHARYEKPSQKRKHKKDKAIKRIQKRLAVRFEKEGY